MSQFPHDQFAKDLLETLLLPFGRVETDRKISSEVREIDVCFFPNPAETSRALNLGLLGRLAATGAAFEPFRNPASASEIRSCMSKLSDLHAELHRLEKRERSSASQLPQLWILTPTLAAATLKSFGAITDVETWGEGVYLIPPAQKTGIVVIHQLPETPETLWSRVLGKSQVQTRGISEIHRLSSDSRERQKALELLSALQLVLETKKNRTTQERELLMSLKTSPAYLEQIEKIKRQSRSEGLAEGLAEGLGEGRRLGERELVVKQLTRKIGDLSAELVLKVNELSLKQLEALGEDLLDFQNVADLESWLA